MQRTIPQFRYIFNFRDEVATTRELCDAIDSFNTELYLKKIDPELVEPVGDIFLSNVLIPIFSCSGHGKRNGHVLFRSFLNKEDTVNLVFDPLLSKFKNYPDVSLEFFFWNNTAIGYQLNFESTQVDLVLNYLIHMLNNLKEKVELSL
jgi:hypothetical protein